MKNSFKALVLSVVSVLALAGCSSSGSGLPSLSGGGSSGGTLSSEPGDNISGQYFDSIVPLNGFIDKIYSSIETEIFEKENTVTFEAEDAGFNNVNRFYQIFDSPTGTSVTYFYSNNELDLTPCNVDIIMGISAFQNMEVPSLSSSYISFSDNETLRSTVFNNIVGHEGDLTPDGWIVNGRNIIALYENSYVRIIELNTNGTISSVTDYVSAFLPIYGSASGSPEFLMDEDGGVLFNEETGEPLIKESGKQDNTREELISILLGSGFEAKNFDTIMDVWLTTRVFYDKDTEISAFQDDVRTVNWWLEATKTIVENPELLNSIFSNPDAEGLAITSDGTVFGYGGDIFSGLKTFSLNGNNNVSLKNGSALTCGAVEDPFSFLEEDEFGVIGGNNGGVMIDDPDILGYDPADFE